MAGALLLQSACGGGGGGGTDDGGGTSSQPPPSGSLDVSGDWVVTENIKSSCPDDPTYDQYPIHVTQSGNQLTVTAGGNSFSGTLSGSTVSWTGSYSQEGGTTSISAMTLTLAGDGNSLSGNDTWSWTAATGAQKCSGTTQIAAQRETHADATAPTVPGALKVAPVAASEVDLSWDKSTDDTGVTGYKVYRDGTLLKTVSGAAATDMGIKPDTKYCYQVSAVDAASNESAKSTEQCATTPLLTDTTAPTAPTNLSLTPTSNQISLSWTAATDDQGVTGYEIYRNNQYLATVADISATDSGLTPGTQYCYQISALDAAKNESGKSLQQCATTGTSTDTVPPSTPGNLALTPAADHVTLSWSAATDNVKVTGYKIYRGGTYIKSVTAVGATDTSLSANTQYCYSLSAVDAAGNESTKTADLCTTTLLAGPVLQGTVGSNGAITLTWTYQWPLLSSNQDGYTLQESTTSATDGFAQIFSSAAHGTADRQSPKTDAITRGPGTYYYRVNAFVNGTKSTAWSEVVTVTVAQPSTTTLTVIPVADNTLVYNTTDSNAKNTVFRTGDLSSGCNWANGAFLSDFVCASSALLFDVQSQISGKTIVSAKLRLYPYILPADVNTTYAVSAFAASWSATAITFANQPQYYISGTVNVSPPVTTAIPLEFDIKTIVQNWANGTWANNGLLLRDANGVAPGYTAYRATSYYSTDNYVTASKRPQLEIQYQ